MAPKLRKLRDRLRQEDSGFTLIELVIVVVIVGILTSIAIPSYGAIQHTARVNAVRQAVAAEYRHSLADLYQDKEIVPHEVHKAGEQIWIEVLGADYRQPISQDNLRVIGIWGPDFENGDDSTYSNRYVGTLVDAYYP